MPANFQMTRSVIFVLLALVCLGVLVISIYSFIQAGEWEGGEVILLCGFTFYIWLFSRRDTAEAFEEVDMPFLELIQKMGTLLFVVLLPIVYFIGVGNFVAKYDDPFGTLAKTADFLTVFVLVGLAVIAYAEQFTAWVIRLREKWQYRAVKLERYFEEGTDIGNFVTMTPDRELLLAALARIEEVDKDWWKEATAALYRRRYLG